MHRPTPARCYVQIRFLPDACRPAYVIRHRGKTLVAVDPRSSRREVSEWGPEHLTFPERDILRRAYDQPPADLPMGDWISDLPIPASVPTPLRLPRRARARAS